MHLLTCSLLKKFLADCLSSAMPDCGPCESHFQPLCFLQKPSTTPERVEDFVILHRIKLLEFFEPSRLCVCLLPDPTLHGIVVPPTWAAKALAQWRRDNQQKVTPAIRLYFNLLDRKPRNAKLETVSPQTLKPTTTGPAELATPATCTKDDPGKAWQGTPNTQAQPPSCLAGRREALNKSVRSRHTYFWVTRSRRRFRGGRTIQSSSSAIPGGPGLVTSRLLSTLTAITTTSPTCSPTCYNPWTSKSSLAVHPWTKP